jgi:hypothetical protein
VPLTLAELDAQPASVANVMAMVAGSVALLDEEGLLDGEGLQLHVVLLEDGEEALEPKMPAAMASPTERRERSTMSDRIGRLRPSSLGSRIAGYGGVGYCFICFRVI